MALFRFLKESGIVWMLLWCITFTTCMSIAKLASPYISVVMLVFARLVFGFLVLMPFLWREGLQHLKTQRLPLHMLRVFFTCGAMLCTYTAYSTLPLALATTIGFTSPMMIALLSAVFLRDYITFKQWLAILFGYLGVYCIISPQAGGDVSGIAIALGANFFAALAILTIKKLTSTESALTIMMYSTGATLAVISCLVPFYWQTPSSYVILLLALLGMIASLSQWVYIKALERGRPALLASFEYLRLLVAVPIGLYIFQEDVYSALWLGATFIIAGNSYIAMTTQKKMSS